jgi:D-tyrosyl-tRNA(Tyr) deacylase
MRAVVQRVLRAVVVVNGQITGQVDRGLLVLLGITHKDRPEDARWLAGKVAGLRVFGDVAGRMNTDVRDEQGAVLVVPQFTLYGDVRKGRRPSFDEAAAPSDARDLYEAVVRELQAAHVPVSTGEFQAMMQVELVNDGPVTFILESPKKQGPGTRDQGPGTRDQGLVTSDQ